MISRRQIKSLLVTSDPITAELSQEMGAPLDNNCIADTQTYCYMFLDRIQSRKKLVRGSGNDGQEWSMEVKQDHMVMFRKYGGQKGNGCHGRLVVL